MLAWKRVGQYSTFMKNQRILMSQVPHGIVTLKKHRESNTEYYKKRKKSGIKAQQQEQK